MARSSVDDFIVDFGKEEEAGGGATRFKPDTYHVRIVGTKTGVSEDKGTPYLELTLIHLSGKYRKKKFTERLYVRPKAFSRFRLLLEAVDIKQPGKLNLVKLAPKLKGKDLYVEVDDDESREPVRSRVTFQGFINPDDYDPDAADEDEEDEEDEDEDLDEDEEDEDLDEDEDEDEDEEEEEEEEPPKRRRARAKKAPAKRSRKRVEEDEDEEDDDDEDEPPARKRSKAKPKATAKKKTSRKSRASDDEDEDEDLDDLDLDNM